MRAEHIRSRETTLEAESRKYEKLDGDKVRCLTCPHKCVILPGKIGICKTRKNKDGKLYSLAYGEITSIAMDPIEKKPLYHFWPSSWTLSISTFGCSFKCPWCQNWSISQAGYGDVSTREMSPEDVVLRAEREGSKLISYTYNEPMIWFEFVLDTSKLAEEKGMMNVLVTNGYIAAEALEDLVPHIDAANIDVKSIEPEFYRKYCGARLEPVLEAAESMKEKGVHVEVTNLIIPGLNDDRGVITKLCRWHLDVLGDDTPLHFSRFFPTYKFSHVEPTPSGTIEDAVGIAKGEGLKYVYAGNMPGSRLDNTYCPSCGCRVVARVGFAITGWNLDAQFRCSHCGEKIPISGKA